MPHKSFQSEAENAEAVTFDFSGDQYAAAPVCPGGLLFDLAAIEKSSTAEQAKALLGFLDEVLIGDSADRLAARLRDPANPLGVKDLNQLVEWLMGEVYGGRPTDPSSPSPGGPSPTGQDSTGAAVSAASTP